MDYRSDFSYDATRAVRSYLRLDQRNIDYWLSLTKALYMYARRGEEPLAPFPSCSQVRACRKFYSIVYSASHYRLASPSSNAEILLEYDGQSQVQLLTDRRQSASVSYFLSRKSQNREVENLRRIVIIFFIAIKYWIKERESDLKNANKNSAKDIRVLRGCSECFWKE